MGYKQQGLVSLESGGKEHPIPQSQQLNLPGGEAQSVPGHQGPFWGRDESLGPGPPVVPFVPAGAWMRPGIQRDWPRWGRQTTLEG